MSKRLRFTSLFFTIISCFFCIYSFTFHLIIIAENIITSFKRFVVINLL